MVTSIAKYQNSSAVDVQRGFVIEGLEGLDQSDVILPRKTIVQPTSKKEGADDHLGWFHDNLTNGYEQAVEAVILQVSRARTLWSDDLASTKPECSSHDGAIGRTYGACATCQFNADHNRQLWETSDAPRCDRGYLFLCANVEDETMFLLGAMRTSVTPAKLLISTLVQKKRSPFSVVVRFTSEKIVNDKGKFYILKPSIVRLFDGAETARWRDLHLTMQGVQIADIDPDEAATAPPPDTYDDDPGPVEEPYSAKQPGMDF